MDMSDPPNPGDEFHLKCGKILRMALHIEGQLDFFIMQYFIRPQTQLSFFFRDTVLVEMNFSPKAKLFNKICKEIDAEKNTVKEVNKAMEFVKKYRDVVAHREARVQTIEEGIKLYTKRATRIMEKKYEIRLTDKLVKEVDDKRIVALNGINKIYAKAGAFRNITVKGSLSYE